MCGIFYQILRATEYQHWVVFLSEVNMKCPKCQHENPDGSKFCLECGNKMEFQRSHYGNILSSSTKFHNKCDADGWVEKYEQELAALS